MKGRQHPCSDRREIITGSPDRERRTFIDDLDVHVTGDGNEDARSLVGNGGCSLCLYGMTITNGPGGLDHIW